MKPRHFLGQLDRQRIETAIHQAELVTSGEIRVVVTRRRVEDAVAAARAEFARLRLHQTRQRNAILLFVAPASQAFAVIGDEGVHTKCGDTFWSEVASAMQGHFRAGQHTAALIEGIERAGRLLGEHFPRQPDDVDELPNQVVED
ncbi:MAG TPA: TPM domain-containing protein [Lacunisphaera sp.]|jgi:uncharacterized membrane protein|nr:TPM domain-containing protein [Lacunisphaera sp.]